MALSDEDITRMAKARVEFKQHLATYFIVNAVLVAIWAATSFGSYFWPFWPILGWGIGLAFHGFNAYGDGGSVAKEEEKIRRKQA